MKSLEDRITYLETRLMAHGIQDTETLSVDVSPLAGNNLRTASTPPHEPEGPSQDLVGHIALESLQTDSFATSLINRNGLSLLNSLLTHPIAKLARGAGTSEHHTLLHELPYETRAGMPPKGAARRLIDTYFEHCDFFSPIISSKEDFFATIEPLYSTSDPGRPLINAKFRALIVFGTAILLLNRSDPSVPISRSEGYFVAAVQVFARHSNSICTGDLEHLINLLLIIQHSCFCSNLTAAWHFLGLATRLAIELNLHNEKLVMSRLNLDAANIRRWLFWATYVFERNLCVIIGRPFSIPDEAIETQLPDAPADEPRRLLAIHLIKVRRLESEMHTTLHQKRPLNGALLDPTVWKNDMRRRLFEWHASVPPCASQFAPTDLFPGYLHNAMVLLHYPSPLLPKTSNGDLFTLAEHARSSIECYRRTFRSGELRFYWRTVHNLFRSGVAAVYCSHVAEVQQLGSSLGDLTGALNSCSSILWGMVERYPPGKAYRDIFENLVSSVARQDCGTLGAYGHDHLSMLDHISAGLEDTDLPLPAIDTISWGFGNSQPHDEAFASLTRHENVI